MMGGTSLHILNYDVIIRTNCFQQQQQQQQQLYWKYLGKVTDIGNPQLALLVKAGYEK